MDGAQALFDASEPVFRALGWAVAFMEVCDDEATMVRLIAPEDDPVGEYARSILGRRAPLHVTPVVAEVVRTGEPLFLDNIPVTQAGGVREAIRLSESMVRAGAARSAWCPVRSETGLAAVLVAVGRDLTEHDFVALQLFAAQLSASAQLRSLRLETVHRERLAAVGEMAAVLAHEVRNSLGVFFAAVGALSRANPARRSDWASLLNILQDEADRVQRLVTDLLEFSSGSTPVMESVPVGPIVLDVIQAAQHDASFQTAQPTVHVDVAADLLVRTDRVLLHRALLNVVVNAFQHVSSGGAVDVIATSLRSEVCLTISNDGLPIPLAVAKRVFEPFFTTQPTGTGLGLAIVRRVCTDIGSRVDVVPRPDGATFRIMLPRGT
jgi:signal transduction histidine kinase